MKLTIEIDNEKIQNLLIAGIEGGSNYWAAFSRTKGTNVLRVRVHIQVAEVYAGKVYNLNDATLAKGLEVMALSHPWHFGAFLAEDDDAETSDVFIQCCCFGKLIYG